MRLRMSARGWGSGFVRRNELNPASREMTTGIAVRVNWELSTMSIWASDMRARTEKYPPDPL
jgi:hypothetical protein